MSQKYYCERLLPVYIEAIQKARSQDEGFPNPWVFQEDNNPSHSHKKPGLAHGIKEASWIDTIIHPVPSPDLNPMEGVWNIIKQRIRCREWRSIEELKALLQEEWDRVTMKEIRARISEMPERCKSLVKTGGKSIKSELW
jgi:hypothetical protein